MNPITRMMEAPPQIRHLAPGPQALCQELEKLSPHLPAQVTQVRTSDPRRRQ